MNQTKTYICTTCHGINSSFLLHCRFCGVIPGAYSLLGKPSVIRHEPDQSVFLEVVVAYGAERQNFTRCARIRLQTVELTQYAEV